MYCGSFLFCIWKITSHLRTKDLFDFFRLNTILNYLIKAGNRHSDLSITKTPCKLYSERLLALGSAC